MDKTNLTLAKANKNDEFYTTREQAKLLIDPFKEQLINLKIVCPCDKETSEIYKYLKELNMNVDCFDRYESVDYSKYDIVVTNPPFSKMKDFMCNYIKDKKYLLFSNWGAIRYNWFARRFIKQCTWKHYNFKFNNSDKIVGVSFITNLNKPDNYIQDRNKEIIDGKVYSQNIFRYTQRKDFACICEYTANSIGFVHFIFGKDTKWIEENIKDLYEIRYNLVDNDLKRKTYGRTNQEPKAN